MHLHEDNRNGGRKLYCLAVCFAGCEERNGAPFTLERCKCFILLDDHITPCSNSCHRTGRI